MPDSSVRRTLPVMEAPTKASVTIFRSFDADGVGRETPTRGVLFLSHATPEENTFAAWLAAQLVSAGYEVWCDLTKLLGGERFWRNIDEAIDRHTFRFLFVSTLLTHQKPGAQSELNLAFEAQERLGCTDFVIPLKIDAFPFGSMDPRLRDLNIMRFDEGWHAALVKLLKLLEREGAPKSPTANASTVSAWYARSFEPNRKVQVGDEPVYSNWFRFQLPETLWFHRLTPAKSITADALGFTYPFKLFGEGVLSFAAAPELEEAVGPIYSVATSRELDVAAFLASGDEGLGILPNDASNMVTDLVGQAWAKTMRDKSLQSFELASRSLAWFFEHGKLDKNRAKYIPPRSNRQTFRQLVGAKSKRTLEGAKVPDGFWHYAISALVQLHPFPRIVIRHHVVFTTDGVKPWKSAERMHRARRRVCKRWWNAEWRDRLFAVMAELSGHSESIALASSADASIAMASRALSFTSPRRFLEDNEVGLNETSEVEMIEDEEVGDEEDDDDGAA